MIFWLDQQPWVQAWNSVNFLNMFFKPQIIVASIFVEFKGWLVAMALVAIGFPLAIPIGLALAFAKMSKIAPVRWLASTYVNVIRGTPLFLQIYIAFFGLPLIGIQGNKYVLGIIVLALNSSAYLAEIFRAGIQSISRGQFEAASSLGMTYWQAMQNVIVPQTVKRVLPTMTSEFILLYKDTAMLSAVGVFELMMYSKNLSAITGNVTPYVVAAGFYLIVTTPLIYYVRTLEERLAVAEGGATPPAQEAQGLEAEVLAIRGGTPDVHTSRVRVGGDPWTQPIVRIQQLHKYFGSNEVLKGIDLDVNKGEVVVILGPSGSGKSTMLRCINKLEEPTGGKIFFEDTEITDPATNINKIRENIGMVFQSFNLFPHLTAKGNVMLAQQKVLGRSKAEAARDRRCTAGQGRPGRQDRLLPGAALRRPAAARRHRACAGDGPARDAVRRGDLGARPRARPRRPRRHEGSRQGRHDHDRRDSRDGFRS